ncbi:MAG: fatty acid desaturase, partial [Ignavibacteria bacterium]|nr:fatty acid desaturase [Ignavibacteria bacterium]
MGILIALIIITAWFIHLYYSLTYLSVDFSNGWTYLHIFLQAFLYTGLFITAHDAMHRTVSKNKKVNDLIGRIASFLFAGMSYSKLLKNHHLHHKYPASDKDPDFYTKSQNLFLWWIVFFYRYATITQLLTMAIAFNILKFVFNLSEINLWFYWIIPA